MMGQHDRSEALFYYFRLEDQLNCSRPIECHPRLGEAYIDLCGDSRDRRSQGASP